MLAEDEISFRIAGETMVLRPSLRAAIRLERRFGGFDKIIEQLAEENVTTMAAVMRESADSFTTVPDLIDSLAEMPLLRGMETLKEPLIAHVLRLAGHKPEDAETEDTNAKRVTFAEHHARLFAIGTGWLGWSPQATYDATAAEIEAAFAGRVDMLKAVFGSANEDTSTEAPTPEQFNAKVMAFAKAMGTRKVVV
jgi:hypothetical protein